MPLANHVLFHCGSFIGALFIFKNRIATFVILARLCSRRCGSSVSQPSAGPRRDIHRADRVGGCVNGGLRPPCARPSSLQNEITKSRFVVGKNACFGTGKRHSEKGNIS